MAVFVRPLRRFLRIFLGRVSCWLKLDIVWEVWQCTHWAHAHTMNNDLICVMNMKLEAGTVRPSGIDQTSQWATGGLALLVLLHSDVFVCVIVTCHVVALSLVSRCLASIDCFEECESCGTQLYHTTSVITHLYSLTCQYYLQSSRCNKRAVQLVLPEMPLRRYSFKAAQRAKSIDNSDGPFRH